MSSLRPTCVSAPGKVLLVGGYVVLDAQYSGLVLSSTARFYSQVEAKNLSNETTESASSEWRQLFPLAVESKQFNQLIDGWIEENDGRFRFQLRENSHRNLYIEETVLCTVNGVAGLEAFKNTDTFQQLKETKMGVHVTLRGDNDFYSQVQRLQDAKLPLRRTNLQALEAFLPPTMEVCEERGGKLVALKTGMGSSAALVTSLVAALVEFFVPTMSFDGKEKDLELVHNLAQLSHCYVQRKIGSGFDISAACFGSQRYTRFPASILSAFTSEEAMKPEEIANCITDRALWNTSSRVKSVRLPSSFHLMMGDVSFGSATVSMVRQVMKWQKEQPEHAKRVMDEIHHHNLDVERGFAEICELEASHSTSVDWETMAVQDREQWSTTDARIGAVLLRLSEAFSRFRELMREMGTSAGVPIEPPEQTAILDATLAIPGVLLAGVPGAGGYDAICVVVIHECALQAVEDLWVQWPTIHPNSIICPLLCDIDRGLTGVSSVKSGLQLHPVESSQSARKGNKQNLQSTVRGHKSNTQIMSKRKISDEDDVEGNRMVKVQRNDEQVGRVEERFSIPGLRFATESWAGMKTSNEDRHVSSTEFFPGPVFGIFDGHGGTFSADFLSRHLVKNVASAIRQNVGGKAFADLHNSQQLSSQEKARKDAIVEQVKLLREQLAELEAMKSDSAVPDSENSAQEVQILVDQLTDAISQMDNEVTQIDAEQGSRRDERREWCHGHQNHFLKSFKDAFERVDSQILQKNPSQDGSTALLVWFLADTASFSDDEKESVVDNQQRTGELNFYTVNVGDCRAVMCRGGQSVPLTSDHKPDRPDEKQRIEKAGGFVDKIAGISRVYSVSGAGLVIQREASTYLAVSRAFGDRALKTPTPLVSCEPEVKRFTVRNDDLFLVLACDGVWDVLSEQDVVDIALPHFHDAKAAADAIVKAAYKKGSLDNLTATVIQFGWNYDVQLQQALESSKMIKSNVSKGRNDVPAETQTDDGSVEEIDMFNL